MIDPALWVLMAVVAGLSVAVVAVAARARGASSRPEPVCEETAGYIAAGWRPLVDCPRNCDACLRCFQVDRCVTHRLRELGLTPGTQIRVVQDAGGPMLLSVRGSRVALGRDLAEKMWVEVDLPAPIGNSYPIG